ncbi:5-(carboxyamino)imidazole ribonucleotide synthase [Fredinandcohnia quinoae]|uniref:N5-carboxyaminoimidazole ribonucleotide synthase n=1 Tax=Fredinandcohnia quinoae TaxID=2918902 RepID=A0AAW5E7C5_9BACI|nr:5-(carboxyamino)imidazole ribonucleotide synthase [Fredinandcohnia sp. SECRCQ15]MCH1624684.1 5-(carboxyamino)imidazole ribonucleotide synthase [Fredinandcohnia sp. SECRCQ15]
MSLTSHILPGQTIGIIGGGQLGRMMALSAREMGFNIAVLDPTPNSPCGQVADIEITASYDDLEAIKKLASISDVITYEFENIDYETLTWLEWNANLPQGSQLLKITQDRGTEKSAIQKMGLKVAPFEIVNNEQELVEAIQLIGMPSVLKTCRGGYDGKGQIVLKHQGNIEEALPLFDQGTCILEGWIPFEKEISVIVTRNSSGDVKTFPVSENIHIGNILHQSIVPARISTEIEENAREMAMKLAKGFELVGTLAVEMFVTKNGDIFINELAPRPHNSGHYTIDACETSQFEQHIRSVCNLPLGDTTLLKPVVMTNVLGEHLHHLLEDISSFGCAKIHLYGKKEAKFKRKMGHITFLGDTIEEALKKSESIRIFNNKLEAN